MYHGASRQSAFISAKYRKLGLLEGSRATLGCGSGHSWALQFAPRGWDRPSPKTKKLTTYGNVENHGLSVMLIVMFPRNPDSLNAEIAGGPSDSRSVRFKLAMSFWCPELFREDVW